MARAHLFRPVTDEAGNLLYGAEVTVRDKGQAAPITQPIYGSQFGTEPIENPFIISGGYIDIWLDTPERVSLLITSEGRDAISVTLDVHAPASEMVRTSVPITVVNDPGVSGVKVLTAISATEASWEDVPVPGVVPAHNHEGAGTNSVALGDNASASAADTTAVGDDAVATAAGATSFGKSAQATGAGGTAVGHSAVASGANSVALGEQANASQNQATAVGSDATASGQQATALGNNAQALGDQALAVGDTSTAGGAGAVALGAGAVASSNNAMALGTGASATHDNSVAIGAGAATTADDQVALGTASHTVLVVGNLQSQADAHIAGAASVLAFFGQTGATRQIVSGSDGGNLVLRALLDALHAIGLIDNQSTEGP